MASKGMESGLVLVLVVMLWNEAAAQSGCTSALMGMSSCLNYVTGNSSTPSSSCCSQLAGVVKSQPQCLCSVLNGGGGSLGISINQTLALSLPGACSVQTPPLSQCNAASGPTAAAAAPVASPMGSPADSANETPQTTPSESNVPSGAGSKTTPSTDGATSDGNRFKFPHHFVVLLLFIASWVSTSTRL